jgi:copper chaperone
MTQTSFTVPGIKCDGCAETIDAALTGTPGVTDVLVDVPTREVAVEHDEMIVSSEELRSRITAVGFPPA